MRCVRLACAATLICAGCPTSVFTCEDDADCSTGGPGGACSAQGWCSFPDDACPSGQRYGEHAGDGLGGACVPTTDDGSTSATTMDATDTSGADTSVGSTLPTATTNELTTTTTTGPTGTTDGPADSTTTGDPVDPDLIAWFTFDDPDQPYADHSGNGLDALCQDEECPVMRPGPRGSAAVFDGIDDHLELPDPQAFATEDALTLALWIDADEPDASSYQDVLTKAFGDGPHNSWGLGFPDAFDGMRFVIYDGNATVFVHQEPWPPRGGWHHVAATWDGTVATLYIDGVPVGESDFSQLYLDDHPVLIGADINVGIDANFFTGTLDDVRLYRRSLDQSEIQTLVDS